MSAKKDLAEGFDSKIHLVTAGAVLAVIIAVICVTLPGNNLASAPEASSEASATVEGAQAEGFPSWAAGSTALQTIVSYVTDVCDQASPNYVEPADRIATFDMDGTILCEKAPIYFDYCMTLHRVLDDPSYQATEEERVAMQQVRDHAYTYGETFKPEGITKDMLVATAFAGMTPEQFREYVVNYADNTPAVGFSGMTYGQSFYKPMLEVIDYLRANDFDVWMVSACEREVVRALATRIGVPLDHVIATDVVLKTTGQGEFAPIDYTMGSAEQIVLSAPLEEECGKTGKSLAIAREIGKRPIIAFGNSSGDYSMLNYALGNPYHRGMGVLVVADDEAREYGNVAKAQEIYALAGQSGWLSVSMANDWATIYGDGVVKTELPLAMNAAPQAEAPAEAPAETPAEVVEEAPAQEAPVEEYVEEYADAA